MEKSNCVKLNGEGVCSHYQGKPPGAKFCFKKCQKYEPGEVIAENLTIDKECARNTYDADWCLSLSHPDFRYEWKSRIGCDKARCTLLKEMNNDTEQKSARVPELGDTADE